jgi:hypothetical protein
MISQKPLTSTTKSDKVDTMITQKMINYIDTQYETSDPYFWDRVYKNVLDLVSNFVEGNTLTDDEVNFVKWVYDDLVESNS